DRLDVGRGQRGDAAQPSEEVERGSLGGEDRPGLARHGRNLSARADAAAIDDDPGEADIGVERLEGRLGEVEPRHHAGLTRDDRGRGGCAGGDDRVRGDIAGRTQILIERGQNGAFDEKPRQGKRERRFGAHARDATFRRREGGTASAASLAMASACPSVRKLRLARRASGSGKALRKGAPRLSFRANDAVAISFAAVSMLARRRSPAPLFSSVAIAPRAVLSESSSRTTP